MKLPLWPFREDVTMLLFLMAVIFVMLALMKAMGGLTN